MHRAVALYAVMLIGLIAGISGIVWLGQRQIPPQDVSGTWQLEPGPGTEKLGPTLRIQQSGRYWHLTFDNGFALDLVWREEKAHGDRLTIVSANRHSRLRLDLAPSHERFDARLSGPRAAVFSATRVAREAAIRPPAQRLEMASHSRLGRLLESPIGLLIAQVFVVLTLCRVMGWLFSRIHQPQVVGEMLAGIMLGPSLLGLLFPVASAALFPQGGLANLNTLSQVGVIFFLFLIGLELDPKLIRERGHAAVIISHASIIAPFLLGTALTLLLYRFVFNNNQQMRFLSVSLFMGASMSITAFPVLARILTERNLQKTPVGAVAITCAAVDDVTAWCMLAFVVAVARAKGVDSALWTAGLSAAYVLAMFFVVRPFLRRLQAVHDRGGLSQNVVALIFLLTLASAYLTEIIGIHALFGAFLMGAIMPKGTRFVRTLTEKLEDFTVVFLLPLFFAFTGLKTQIALLNHGWLWVDTALIVLCACLGKFGGSTAAAMACGINRRESSVIGILMNTRGLMELVILNIGQDLGVITPAVFAMMVIMALVTTGMTTPVLQLLGSRRIFGTGGGRAPNVRRAGQFTVMIPVADPRSAQPLLNLAEGLAGTTETGGRIVALHLSLPPDRDAYRTGLREAQSELPPDPLKAIIERAAASSVAVKPVAFVSQDVPADIVRLAQSENVDLVLMGFHKSVVSRAILGGTVHRVLSQARTDVGVFVDRGLTQVTRVLVPYLGGKHDRLAMELTARLARNRQAQITVLHVVDPDRGDREPLNARDTVEKVYKEGTQPAPVTVRVVEDISPVDAVLKAAGEFDLVVLGISEKWGLSSHLFGWKPERIAEKSPVSLLIVRQFESATGIEDEVQPSELSSQTTTLDAVGQGVAQTTEELR